MKKRMLITLLSFLLVISGCGSDKPRETLENFLKNVQQGDLEQAQKSLEPESSQIYGLNLESNNEIEKTIFSRITYEIMPDVVKSSNNVSILVKISSLDTSRIMRKTLDEITAEGFRGSIFTGFQQAVARSEEFTIKNLKDENATIKTEEIYITLSSKKGDTYYIVVDEKINNLFNKDKEIVIDILNTFKRND